MKQNYKVYAEVVNSFPIVFRKVMRVLLLKFSVNKKQLEDFLEQKGRRIPEAVWFRRSPWPRESTVSLSGYIGPQATFLTGAGFAVVAGLWLMITASKS